MKTNLDAEDKSKIGVYILHNPKTDQLYVGSGILGPRKKVHETLLENNKHWNYKLQNAYNKSPGFEFKAIPVTGRDDAEIRKTALVAEQTVIDLLSTNPFLMNIALHVEAPMTGYKHTPEAIESNRQAALTMWRDPKHRDAIIAAQNAGRDAVPLHEKIATSEKLSMKLIADYASGKRVSTKGQTRSEEFCKERSCLILDKWKDPVYKENQRLGRVGKMIGPNKVAVSVDGVPYTSMTAAAAAHGITKQSVIYRLDSTNHPGWQRTMK